MARNWSRDWLVPLLLLCVKDGSVRGRELIRAMHGFGLDALRPAALYRALRGMEREGMILSAPSPEGESLALWPARRRYEITPSGEAYLTFWANALEHYREEMNLFLELYAEHSTREHV